jgi:hypothetical protein
VNVIHRSRLQAVPGPDPAAYRPHALHGEGQVWPEKNCYVDVWIEMLHTLGLDPLAMLSFTLAVDFEGDQWTFFKPPHADLHALYGIDVQELTVWRPLIEHLQEHLGAGQWVSTEADAWWLPDTVGTDYRRQHTKTTIVVNDLDLAGQRLGYFHNASYFALEGEDFRQLLGTGGAAGPLPLYAERVRMDRLRRLHPADLHRAAASMLVQQFERRPATNPLRRFADRFARDLPQLHERGLAHYHQWAFATIRQCGSAFELAAAHLRWQAADHAAALDAARACMRIAEGCKTLILKAARSVATGRALDAAPLFDDMVASWDEAMMRSADFVRGL